MNQTENKVGVDALLVGLSNTASLLGAFLNQTREGLPQEQKELLDKEFSKTQADLSKVVSDINNFKL